MQTCLGRWVDGINLSCPELAKFARAASQARCY